MAGLGPGGPFGVDVVAGEIRIRFLVPGGVAGTGGLAPGGRWGMRVERSVAAIPFAGAVRAQGVVARWGRAVGSGSGGGGVGSGGGGAAGGGGVGSGGVGVVGMAHGPLVGFPVPLVGVGGLASWAVPGAALCDGGRGVSRPWVCLAGGGGGLWGIDDGALGDGDADEGLDGVVLGGRLCGGGGCRWEGGVGCGGWGVLAWVRVRVGVVSVGLVSSRLGCCVCSRGRQLGFGVGFGVGVRFQVEEYLCLEV